MTIRARSVITHIDCDAKDCGLIFPIRLPNPWYTWTATSVRYWLQDNGPKQGWSCWAGRSQRHYCPDHGPRRPDTMWRVW